MQVEPCPEGSSAEACSACILCSLLNPSTQKQQLRPADSLLWSGDFDG